MARSHHAHASEPHEEPHEEPREVPRETPHEEPEPQQPPPEPGEPPPPSAQRGRDLGHGIRSLRNGVPPEG